MKLLNKTVSLSKETENVMVCFFQSLAFITVVQQITLNIFLSCLFLILLTSITDKQAPAKSCHFLLNVIL